MSSSIDKNLIASIMADFKMSPDTLYIDEFIKYYTSYDDDIIIECIKFSPLVLKYVKNQTVEYCITALEVRWDTFMYNMINIPIEGELLKRINKLKLVKGSMVDNHSRLSYYINPLICRS